jgi:hypothetical protein
MSDQDGSANLLVRHSREGGLFRRWIQTFLEVEHGVVWDKSEYTEDFVDKVVSGTVKEGVYWSMLVEGSERNGDSMDCGVRRCLVKDDACATTALNDGYDILERFTDGSNAH